MAVVSVNGQNYLSILQIRFESAALIHIRSRPYSLGVKAFRLIGRNMALWPDDSEYTFISRDCGILVSLSLFIYFSIIAYSSTSQYIYALLKSAINLKEKMFMSDILILITTY